MRARAYSVLLACIAGLVVLVVGPAHGASTAVTVTADVPSAISLTNNCKQTAGWNLGTVLPGATALSDRGANICAFGFQSSNDSAMLRVGQVDGTGTAMSSTSLNLTLRRGAASGLASVALKPGTPGTAVFTVGDDSYTTTTSGGSWTLHNGVFSLNGAPPMDLSWVSGTNYVYGAGHDGDVYRSADGGTTWTPIAVPAALDPGAGANDGVWLSEVEAPTQSTVYVSGDAGNVWRCSTCDTAPVWTQLTTGLSATAGYWGMDALSASEVWVAGSNGKVYRSTNANGGAPTFATMNGGSGLGAYFLDLAVVQNGPNVDVYAMAGPVIFRSTNSGASFTVSWDHSTAGPDELTSVWAESPTSIWATGEGGSIWWSPTGASGSWIRRPSSTGNRIERIVAEGSTGYGVGAGGVVPTSTDGGVTWTKTFAGSTETYLGLDNAGLTVFGVGGNGLIQKSTDGGVTWGAAQTSGTTSQLRAVAAPSATVAYAVGAGGVILKTTDGGASAWSSLSSGTTQDLYAVSAPTTTTVWAVGVGGTVLRSTSGGSAWSPVAPNGNSYTAVGAVDSQIAWIGDGAGNIRKTTDGGQTWSLQQTISNGVASIVAIDSQTAFAAQTDWGGAAWRTTDGGATWTAASPMPYTYGKAMDALNANTALFGGSDLSRSYDGSSFTSDPGWVGYVTAVDMIDAHRVVVANQNGDIQTASPGGNTISDYGAGTNWGSAPATNMFGACLQSIGGTTTVGSWIVDDGNTPGLCEASDTDRWNAVPAAPLKIASTAGAGVVGSASLVWGFRPASNQPAGVYRASVLIEALAPAV